MFDKAQALHNEKAGVKLCISQAPNFLARGRNIW
jgi:hypothetical protein